MEIREPEVLTDGGPWAEHDMSCPVCGIRHSVLDLSYGVFLPCWVCQREGWQLRRSSKLWQRIKRGLKAIGF